MSSDPGTGSRYVFAVEFGLDPDAAELSVDPSRFQATVYRRADPPGEHGWLFFRDHLWRGEFSDSGHFADLLTKSLGVPVVDATFRELQVEEAYLATLRETIGENLGEFRADSVDRALSKYLGSSIRVVDGDERLDAG